jgi:ribonuclease D
MPRYPRGPRRPPPDPEFEMRTERLKTARDRVAEKLRLDRGFLMPRDQIEAIARANPKSVAQIEDVDGIRKWQIEALGEEIVRVLDA